MHLIDNKALQRYILLNLVVTVVIGFIAWYIFGLDGLQDFETWTILFLSCGIISCVISFSSFFVLRKKGVDVYTAKNMLIITLAPLTNVLIPVWLYAQLSFNSKIHATIIIYFFTVISFYAYHYGGKRLRTQIGLETEEDRKEKDAKGKVG